MTAHADFRAIGTSNRIVVTDESVSDLAVALAADHLAALDRAVSRFREDSEISRLAVAARDAAATAVVSPLVVDQIRAAREAHALTGGLVDPTVGAALMAGGYDADLAEVQRRGSWTPWTAHVPGIDAVILDEDSGIVTVPQGCVLDFGATAKARAADTIAALLARRLPGGFLVDLGGDLAVGGDIPPQGWCVAVEGADGGIRDAVRLEGQAMTTSSTQVRTWATTTGRAHHIVDPRTGRPAAAVWGQVSVVAASALQANAASTAATILGEDAPEWLRRNGLPARLERPDGSVVLTPGWPEERTTGWAA